MRPFKREAERCSLIVLETEMTSDSRLFVNAGAGSAIGRHARHDWVGDTNGVPLCGRGGDWDRYVSAESSGRGCTEYRWRPLSIWAKKAVLRPQRRDDRHVLPRRGMEKEELETSRPRRLTCALLV
jgi:hypothetical protein